MASIRALRLASDVKCRRVVGYGESKPSGHIPSAKHKAVYLAKDWGSTPSHVVNMKTVSRQQDASVDKWLAVQAW